MRKQFTATCEAVADSDPKLVVMVGDISVYALRHFQAKHPDRFFNIGILEQAMVSMAAGLAEQGWYPVIHTISPFLVERAYEQIKDDCCYQQLGVNLITVGAACDYVPDGPTHHNVADFAILRVLPGMQLLCPGTPGEFDRLFRQTYNNGQTTYCRLSATTHDCTFPPDAIVFGRGVQVKEGRRLLVVVAGPRLKAVMEAVGGEDVDIVYFHTLKPFDAELVRHRAETVKQILCVEEHHLVGGLGALVAEAVEAMPGVTVTRLGMPDRFQSAYGTFAELIRDVGIDAAGIRHTAQRLLRGEHI